MSFPAAEFPLVDAASARAREHLLPRPPVIAISALSRTFHGPPVVHALAAIDLTVERGDYLAIVGPSGSGKSTLLNQIGLLDTPSSGRYLLDGLSTTELTETQRTALRGHRIGFVFQDFHLLSYRTATENVALGQLYIGKPDAERIAAARDALTRVGLAHRLDAFPSTMSGGERQRVAIARALATQPSLLLCDEPTGNLDSATAAHVLDLFDHLNKEGVTIVVITHDPETAARATSRVTIHDGHIGAS